MPSFLALDIGDSRIGLATGNNQARLARPHGILTRRSKQEDFAAIARTVAELDADTLLVGLPYNMDGSEGEQAKRVRKYVGKMQQVVDLPVIFHDERLSSFEADQIIAQNARKRASKHNDDIAAATILQSYFSQVVD